MEEEMIGLKKGQMYCAGVGIGKQWTMTYTTKTCFKMYDVWKIFSYILSNMHSWQRDLYLRMYMGDGHLLLKSRHNHDTQGVAVDRDQITNLLQNRVVTDTYVQKVGQYFGVFSRQMSGSHMRLFTDMTQFCLMSTEYFEQLKSMDQEKYRGLYADQYGFCCLSYPRQRTVCKIGKKDQCIFAKAILRRNAAGKTGTWYLCGKFMATYAQQQQEKFARGDLSSQYVGPCEDLRGIEI